MLTSETVIKSIIAELMRHAPHVTVPAESEADVNALILLLRTEHTVLFHVGEIAYLFYPRRHQAVLTPQYLYSAAEYTRILDQLQDAVQRIGQKICQFPTAARRELAIHDLLCTHLQYADDGPDSHSLVGPLLHKRGVCDGISKTAKVLLQTAGIPAHVLYGTGQNLLSSTPEPHAWNIVCLNGRWYHADITFDATISDGMIRYDYYNRSTAEILADHAITPTAPFADIDCPESGNYYQANRLYFTDMGNLQTYWKSALQARQTQIQLQIAPALFAQTANAFHKCTGKFPSVISYQESSNPYSAVFAWTIQYR